MSTIDNTYAFLAEFGKLVAQFKWFFAICIAVLFIIYGIWTILENNAVDQINNNIDKYDVQYIENNLSDYYLSPINNDTKSPIKSKTIMTSIFAFVIFLLIFSYVNRYLSQQYKPYAAAIGTLSLFDIFHFIF
jgi:hypothetical protein